MNKQLDVFDLYSTFFESRKQTELSLRDYLNLCRETPTTFANAAERMIAAIGEPEVIDTAQDPRLVTENSGTRLGPGLELYFAAHTKSADNPAQQDAALVIFHLRSTRRAAPGAALRDQAAAAWDLAASLIRLRTFSVGWAPFLTQWSKRSFLS